MALKDIKLKIQATKRMNKVTRAMEAVSAVKMRKTQNAALGGRAYARAAVAVLTRLAGTEAVKRHPLAKERERGKIALLVITSDKGLAGGLNAGVLKRAVEFLTKGKEAASAAGATTPDKVAVPERQNPLTIEKK